MWKCAVFGVFGLALVGCGGAGTSANFVVDTTSADAIRPGTVAGPNGSNGIAFATTDDTPATLEGMPVQVRMARFTRDRSTRNATLLMTDETITLPVGYYAGSFQPSTFTLDGVTYALTSSTVAVGNVYQTHTDIEYGGGSSFANRHRISFSQDGGVDTFWEYAYFIVGAEMDPAAAASLGGSVTYDGSFNIQGFPSRNGGEPSDLYRPFNGTMSLTLDFDTDRVGGTFSGFSQPLEEIVSLDHNISGVITGTDLVGNGFGTTMVITDCVGFASCTSDDSVIGGAIYGAEADKVAGIIMLDATFTDESGNTSRLLGPGTFTTDPVAD